ncbi:MAG: alpha/beta hydrolase-fold protein [Phycisphaerales bacterium]
MATLSKPALTAFLITPFLMAGSILFAIPRKGHARDATAPALQTPAPAQPAAASKSETGKKVRPETLKQGYIIRVKDLTGLATPDSPVYLAHSHNGWDPGDKKYKLQQRSDMRWEIVMTPAAADSAMEFKFTRGSWEYEELTKDMTVPGNRMLPDVDAKYVGSEEKPEFVFEIPHWGDQRPNVQARADVNPYYYLNTTGTVKRLEVVGGDAAPYKRDLLVWLPPGYDAPENAGRKYPVLYMHDGQNLFQKHPAVPAEWGVDETATKLINEKTVEPFIVVGIPHSGKLRTVEYLPPVTDARIVDNKAPGGEAYVQWIVSTVMPRVERAFRVRTGPENTAIGGSSMGGLISLYAGAMRPQVFGKVLAESPSLGFNHDNFSPRLFGATKTWPAKVYLAVGGKEAGGEKPEASAEYAGWVKSFNDSLQTAGLGDDRRMFVFDENATHNEEAWAKRLPAALKFLFPAK